MSINKNLHYLQSTANVAAGLDEQAMDFVLNLEVLNYCAHHCPGCFVRRKNSVDDIDLRVALNLAREMTEKGLRFREVVISPTDIFSATNSMEVLTNPEFQALLQIHPKTRITTTAMFDNMNWDNFTAVMDVLDNTELYREKMILELLVPMDIEKVLSRDKAYYRDFQRAIHALEYETPKEIDWSFVVNVHHDPEMFKHFDELTTIAKEQFNTVIEFLPSFFRTGSDRYIKEHLEIWRSFLREVVTEDNYRDIMLTIADKQHNAMNTIVVNYAKGKVGISPFIYEQIVFDYPELEVFDPSAEAVLTKVSELLADQFAYAPQTTECSGCQYLPTCVGRNVLSFMELKEIKDCIYPKEILDLYHANEVDAKAPRIVRCADNNE